jgi:hypothetical protein
MLKHLEQFIISPGTRRDQVESFLEFRNIRCLLQSVHHCWFAGESGTQARPMLNDKNPLCEMTMSQFWVASEYTAVFAY